MKKTNSNPNFVINLLIIIVSSIMFIYVIKKDTVTTRNEAYILHEYLYDGSGKNIYVNYSNKNNMTIFNYTKNPFDPLYMKLNNCVPVLHATITEFKDGSIERDNKNISCLKDYDENQSNLIDIYAKNKIQ